MRIRKVYWFGGLLIFIIVLALFVMNIVFDIQVFKSKNLICNDFEFNNKIDCSYVHVGEHLTTKVVSLDDFFIKNGKYYLSFYRYSNEKRKKVIKEEMLIGLVDESRKKIQFKVQNDHFLYPTTDRVISNVPMNPQEFQNYFIKENLKGRNAIVSYTGKDEYRINVTLYNNE